MYTYSCWFFLFEILLFFQRILFYFILKGVRKETRLKGVADIYCQVKSFEVHFNIKQFSFVVILLHITAPYVTLIYFVNFIQLKREYTNINSFTKSGRWLS